MPSFSVVTLKWEVRPLRAVLWWWSWVPESERWTELWLVAGRTPLKWMPDYLPHGRVGGARACSHCLFIIILWGSLMSMYRWRNWRLDAHIRLLTGENSHLMVPCNHPVQHGWPWLCSNLQHLRNKCSHGQSGPLEAVKALAPHSPYGKRALPPWEGGGVTVTHTQWLSSLVRVEVEL